MKENIVVEQLPLRSYQIPFFNTFIDYLDGENSIRRYVLCQLRRAGKDYVALNAIKVASDKFPGTYVYASKTITTAWNIFCSNIDKNTGTTKLKSIFGSMVKDVNKKDHTITLNNDSIIQVVATDDYDKVRGLSVNGIVISEAAFCRSSELLDVVQPSLDETGGFSILVSTPNGKNHFHESYIDAVNDPANSYAELITNDEAGVFTQAVLDSTLRHLESTKGKNIGRQIFLREYYCSFETSIQGAVYDAHLIDEAVKPDINFNPDFPLYVAMDLGFRDHCSGWIFQLINSQWRFHQTFEDSQRPLEHYMNEINRLCKVKPLYIIIPHDGRNRHLQSGLSVDDVLRRHEFNTLVLERGNINDGISAVRRELVNARIDEENCKDGITALRNYRYDWNEDRNVLSEKPLHDQYSHYADAMRYAMTSKERIQRRADRLSLPPEFKRRKKIW